MLFKISDYLKKVSSFSNEQELLSNSIIISFRNVLGIEIKPSEFSFKDGIILIDKSPVVKSEIMLKKDRLLNSINKQTGNKKIFDIK
ncbi:MAG: hypothetical protein WAV11_03120 [Minisyncoccia bacterium]